ncbi:myosin-10-like [Ylistrum balloti]|uniref:myosin-10-like n=1 Tax=Ylistrum balloti TaxID=509963 RepID=UPI002905D31C|nr:myosin-10-like [Ylistrum balloti]
MASKGGDEDTHSTDGDTKQELNTKGEKEEKEKQQPATNAQDQDDDEAGKCNTDHLLQEVSKKLHHHGTKEYIEEETSDSQLTNKPIIENEKIEDSKSKAGSGNIDVETNKTDILDKEEPTEQSLDFAERQELQDGEMKSEELPEKNHIENKEKEDNSGFELGRAKQSETEQNTDQTNFDVETRSVTFSQNGDDKLVEQNDSSTDHAISKSHELSADHKNDGNQLETQANSENKVKIDSNTTYVTKPNKNDDSANLADNINMSNPKYFNDNDAKRDQEENKVFQESVAKSETDPKQNEDSISIDVHKPDTDQLSDITAGIENQLESKRGTRQLTKSENSMDDADISKDDNGNVGNIATEYTPDEKAKPHAEQENDAGKSENSYDVHVHQKQDYLNSADDQLLTKGQAYRTDILDGEELQKVEVSTESEQQLTRSQDNLKSEHEYSSTSVDQQIQRDLNNRNTDGIENQPGAKYIDTRSEVDDEAEDHKEIPDETCGSIQNGYDSSSSSLSTDIDKINKDRKTKPVKPYQVLQSRKRIEPTATATKQKFRAPIPSSNSSTPQMHASRKTSRSAPFRRAEHTTETPAKSTSFAYLRRAKTSNSGRMISRGKKQENKRNKPNKKGAESNKKKDYFQEELRRLRVRLGKEAESIKRPQVKEYEPFVWTSLEPYYNTYVPHYLINLPDEELQPQRPISRGRPSQGDDFHQGYTTRSTAIGLCDPWVDLRMDQSILPKLEQPKGQSKEKPKSQKKKVESSPKEGSTRLPKFPVVDFNAGKENATRMFPYNEVAKFRVELKDRFSSNAKKKVNKDYKRTKDDFYRMDLHKLDEIHPLNRQHMRKTYFAYLQNTPGSRKAVKDCVKTLDNEPETNKETPVLEEQQQQQAVASN